MGERKMREKNDNLMILSEQNESKRQGPGQRPFKKNFKL